MGNYDGDLLFTASKDHIPSVWRTDSGERLGTFNGHKGTIWDLDCCRFTRRVLTASADTYANGRSYASGAEDGYIRLHHFDKSYLDMKDPVPEVMTEGEEEEEEGNDKPKEEEGSDSESD